VAPRWSAGVLDSPAREVWLRPSVIRATEPMAMTPVGGPTLCSSTCRKAAMGRLQHLPDNRAPTIPWGDLAARVAMKPRAAGPRREL